MRYSTAKHGCMVLNVDLKKAYERLEWRFVEETFIYANIPGRLVRVIMRTLQRSTCRFFGMEKQLNRSLPLEAHGKETRSHRISLCRV